MENLRAIIKNHLSDGIVLMDLVHNTNSDYVKITIDSARNLSIKETTKLAKRIKNDDNILSIFPSGCRLEVTTPGIGSNLEKKFQYEKNIGRKMFIKYIEHNSNIVSNTFRLVDVEKEGVILLNGRKKYSVMFENILSAKIIVSFD